MTELIIDQHNTEMISTKDHRMFSETFLVKVSQCIQIANTIRTNYGIDILETNGNVDITDKIINRLDSLSSIYFQNINRNNNNNNIDISLHLSEQHDELQKSTSIYNSFNSTMPTNDDNQKIIEEQFPSEIHSIPIKLPTIIEMQLRHNQLLRDAINNYRRHERYSNLSKTKKISSIKPTDKKDILMIDAELLCPKKSNYIPDSSWNTHPKSKINLTSLMKQIHTKCKNKTNKKKTKLVANIQSILEYIINEEIIYEYFQNEIKKNNQSQQLKRKKKNKNEIIQILPYENTYGQFYYPDRFISIENTMIDKIINGVQAMATALTTTKDVEDVFNGTIMLSDQSSSPFAGKSDNKIADELINTIQKRFMTRKQNSTTNRERIYIRMALNLILADNRLNGTTILCRSESLILSCMLKKIRMCTQIRTLCSYGDIMTTINEVDYHQIHLRTFERMSLSSDEFIEIIGELYQTSYDTIETMIYYLEAHDVIDIDTNLLLHSSILSSEKIDHMIKYILHEDAIRQLIKLIFNRKHNNNLNNENIQLKLILPKKLNDLYQPIKKLNTFMSTTQIMAAIRRPYLVQLTERSKTKAITVNDLRAITSQIWLLPEHFEILIGENTISEEILCQFYIDFHEKEDIDERLNKINKKIQDHLNSHSCITRVVLKMIAEHSNGTNLTPFLDEFNKTPRFISIIDIFDDLIHSGLISTTELIVFSKQDIIIKKSSLLKYFERISFFRKHDVDLLAEISLVIREDDLIEYLTKRAMIMKQGYINCILNTDERRDFITKNIIKSTNRLSSVSIHQFIHYFNLDPNCSKIFYWMGITDENIVKTLTETKTFVNEYTLDGIYNNFLVRLHDTLESGIYYISTENLTINQRNSENLCKLGCYLTYEQASILVDYADPEYEDKLLSLITIHDIIPQESLNNFDNLSTLILQKQKVIECKTLLDSFHQRIIYRQKRFERIENLQKLLLSSILFDKFIEIIPNLGIEYFTRTELDYLEETKLIDIGVLALLLTLPSYNPLIHQHKYEWFHEKNVSLITSNYLHILDPIIEKYSIFLTIIILRIISNKEQFLTINEILLSNPNHYLSTEEVLKICIHEQILSHDDILRICREIFPTKQISSIPDCYTQNMAMYTHDSVLQNKLEQKFLIAIFDCILHFNHQTIINVKLRQLFGVFKPLAIYTAQLLIEKEISIIKLLLTTRKKQTELTIDDLNRYLETYPIPCRLDIVNELRRLKIISQSLANNYTMNQCHELKSSTPDIQSIFIFYMMIKLIREEGYIDDINLKKLLHQYENESNIEKFNQIFKEILRQGFLTIEQILQSTKDFFLQDYLNQDLLKNESIEYKTVIQKPILANILHREQLTNTQFQFALSQNMRRRQVIQINVLPIQLNAIKIAKEKVQRKVDNVLSKMEDNSQLKSSRITSNSLDKHQISTEIDQQSSPNLRSLRHNYIQAKIPRNQLYLLVEQGGWNDDVHQKFKHELDIIDSDNSLDLIQYITHNISLLIKENGSIGEKPLLKHFKEHQILFHADFNFLLIRYGIVELEDLIDLLVVSKLAKVNEIELYAKRMFCLNVNKFNEISKSQEDILVKKNHVLNNLEEKLCITSTDLSELLNHVLKLDRLKRIIELMPTIKNYIRLHPIKTFNAVKALKLEFDFNHYDMKFLRDLKLLNDTWYKQYLLSRISEIGPIVSEVIDEEQEQEDRHEFKFRSSTDEDFDLEAFNELFENKSSKSDMSEQRKQAYLEQIKKRKDKIDSYKSKISNDEDDLKFSLNLDDLQKQKGIEKDQHRVIEEFFPDASALGPQLLVPNVSDDQKRIFIELDFAKEQNIEDYQKQYEKNDRDQRRDIKRQMKKHRHIIDGEEKESIILDTETKGEKEQSSLVKLPSDVSIKEEKDYIEDQSTEDYIEQQQRQDTQPSIEKRLSEIKKSPQSSETDQKTRSSLIKDDSVDEKDTKDELRKSTIKIFPSDKTTESSFFIAKTFSSSTKGLLSKATSIDLPNTTEDLTTILSDSLKQLTDTEQISLKDKLKLARYNVDQWLQQTLRHNEQIDNYHDNQFSTYLHNELNIFDKNFVSLNLKLTNHFQQRINHIENILQEKKNHQEIFQQVNKQIIEIDQMINKCKIDSDKERILQKFNKYKNDFNQIQPILGTRLELAIRTLDADLELIEQILHGKTLTDIIPSTSLITTKISRQPVQEDITFIQDNLSTIITDISDCQTKISEKQISQDLLKRDIAERLQAIKQEYSEQKLNEENLQSIKLEIDKLIELDQQQSEFNDKQKEIHDILAIQSKQIQKNLSNIITARYHSNHPNILLNAKLKFLPVDISGTVIVQPLCLVDEQNISISDELNLIRLPIESDQFQISNDKYELTIVDKNKIPLSNPITFKQLTSEVIEFEYVHNDQRTIQIIETSSHNPISKPIILSVKPISFDKLSSSEILFIVDNNARPISKPIQLIDHTYSSLNISEFNLATFLHDEKTNEKVLLTPEQYLIARQQDEFTSRKFLTYITDHDNKPISEPIQISDARIQMRHSTENTILNKLNLFDKNRHKLWDYLKSSENKNEILKDIFNEYELMNVYIQDRLDKLKTEEKVIEQIVPILDKQHDHISTDQQEYKREQSNMDYLLNTMKSVVQFDEKLTEYRKSKSIESLEIQKLESDFIHQLTEISTQLDDQLIIKQVQNLTNRLQGTQLLSELQPIILSGIKNRAKTIEQNCETLLINIYKKSNQLIQSEQIRFEYIQYLNKRFNQEIEQEKNIENLYDKIERMQYDHYQKIVDSSETIELEDLDNETKHKYQISIPDYLKTKNEKLIYKFSLIVRYIHDELITIEEYKEVLLNEMKGFLVESNDNDSSYIQQIIYLENEIKINNNEKLLKYIEKLKILVNKFETMNEKNLQYNFLFSKLDHLYEIFLNNYQIHLPIKTNIESIRTTLNNLRKKAKKEIQNFEIIKNELVRKLDVLKKKEELKQRTKITSITEESQLSSLNAYIQQSKIEPINIHHEFYAMKIQQIANEFVSLFHTQTSEQHLSIMNSLIKTLDHMKDYDQNLDQQKLDYENKLKSIEEEISIAREYSMVDSLVREQIEDLTKQQKKFTYQQEFIIKMQTIINETFNHLHSLLIPNQDREKSQKLFEQLKQRAMDTILQSIEYNRLSKHVSPHLLVLHQFTSGQELISSITPSSRNLFQLEIKTDIQQELHFQTYLLQPQSSVDFQKDVTQQISSSDSKIQILRTEINYLQKQHAKAIAIGDFTQQLAAERAISNKLHKIEQLYEKQKTLKISQIEIPDKSSNISQKSLITNQVDQKIHNLLKKHIKLLQKRIRNDKSKLKQKESLDKQTIHSVEDLRELNNKLKRYRQENNRQKQIDVQLKILDKIDQLDKESIDQNSLEKLRQRLQEEQKQQGLLIFSSDKLSHHDSHMHILPISQFASESSLKTVMEETKSKSTLIQTTIPAIGELLTQTDSMERMNTSLVTTNAKELYEELQEMRNSIKMAFKSKQIPSNMESDPQVPMPTKGAITIEHDKERITAEDVNTIRLPSQNRLRSNSIEAVNSSLFPANNIPDLTIDSPPNYEELSSSSLLLVGNTAKYSITQTKSKDQQVAKSAQQSIFHSQRDYGEVYVRQRLTDVSDPVSNIDEEKLRDKIIRKTRLVKFEKTRQGNTVIHRPVDLPTSVFLIPQQANYEENLELAPPLIHVNDKTNTIPFKSKRSTSDIEHQSKKSEIILPLHSATIMSPIEEEESEEIEATNGIAFSLTNRDSSTKKYSIDDKHLITIDNDDKPTQKLSALQEIASGSSTVIISHPHQPVKIAQQQKIDLLKVNRGISSSSSLPNDLLPTLKTTIKKSSKEEHELISVEQTKDIQLRTTNDESLSTEGFDIEQPIPITPKSTVIYHKVGGKSKSSKKKKKKTKQKDTNKNKTKMKRNKIETPSQPEPLILTPRKAVPFISATKDKQIDVEDDAPIKHKKKKRKRSIKSNRKFTRSRSSDRSKSTIRKKKKNKHRLKKDLNIAEITDNISIETKSIKNKDVIAMHLLNVKRFTGPPISPIDFDQSRSKYDDIIEISNQRIKKSRLNYLKPMIKNFEFDNKSHKFNDEIHTIDANNLDKELFDFNNDTKDIDQPEIFTEYNSEFFQKQAEEKQIRRISLTAIRPNEHFTKRLAPRIHRLYNGWQPNDIKCAHTDEFHPLNKYLMSDLSYYFDDDFIDESGLFQNQTNFDKPQPQVKQPTQRFRDDYIVKEFFNCWKDYATEKARIAELRRKRVTIDFREFWFQDAFSDPFYSYFEQPPDYLKKQNNQHQMAYHLHKRLVRTGREQPKETMNEKNRSSFLPLLFNLPKTNLDRQGSLTRRRQLINNDQKNQLIPLSNLITNYDEVLPLIRERLSYLNQTKTQINIRRDELAIKELLLNSSLLEQGTMKDLDRLIIDYYRSLVEQEMKTSSISSSNVVKLPLLKRLSIK